MERVGDKRRRIAPDDLGEKGLERQTERNLPSPPLLDPAKLQKVRDELAPILERLREVRKECDGTKTSE